MRIHLIAIGGSIMHNLALALQQAGHKISGSDDEIYEPSRSRLKEAGLLPDQIGWNEKNIVPEIDLVILGMHARPDNPELQKALQSQIKVMSFPEFIYTQSEHKKRVVIAGSHGKTTTTSMIMHVLKHANFDFDYLVGAQIKGFELMVRLSDAPVIIIEGDEYLSSPIDRIPKIWHYFPHIAVITGIAWDHMNVFPTFEEYVNAFSVFIGKTEPDAKIIYYENDKYLRHLMETLKHNIDKIPYIGFRSFRKEGIEKVCYDNQFFSLRFFGDHNLQNMEAAFWVCKELGVSPFQFFNAIQTFEGASKRLQLIWSGMNSGIYRDYAHAPSKVRATVQAMKKQFPQRSLTACFELHTYSSLNIDFLPQYRGCLDKADQGVVFYDPHTIKMKKMSPLDADQVKKAFGNEQLLVFDDKKKLQEYLENLHLNKQILLMMSSGTFMGVDLSKLIPENK